MNEELSQYWQTIIQTMQDGLMVVDPAGVIVSINPVMEEVTGYSPGELIGQSCSVLHCDMCSQVRQEAGKDQHCALFSQGGVRRCRCTIRRKDGRELHVVKSAALLKDASGQVLGGVETLTDLSEVVEKDRVIEGIRQELGMRDSFAGIIGRSRPMRQMYELIESVADSLAPVLILGESGTGKELVANAIHSLGPRAKGPFVKVNCAALNESLLESELFGHVRGAFTGADRERLGRFEAAQGGDFFLDEVGDLPATTQVKLLRVLQEKVVERVGDHHPRPVDVRFIAATNQELAGMVRRGRFRQDLYYRVAVVPIRVPPLRERREDIPLLVEALAARICRLNAKPVPEVSPAAMDLLLRHAWPGNVRELINALEYALVLNRGGRVLPGHLPAPVRGGAEAAEGPAPTTQTAQDQDERQRILAALREAGGRREETARLLGISRVTLWKRMKEHGISTSPFQE